MTVTYDSRNFNGRKLSYAVVSDEPREFKYTFNNNTLNGGYVWHLVEEFARRRNLTLYESYDYEVLSKDPYQIVKLFENGSLDTAPSIFSGRSEDRSYCLEYIVDTQIAPVIFENSKRWYFSKPFHPWSLAIVICTIFLTAIITSAAHRVTGEDYIFIYNLNMTLRIFIGQPFKFHHCKSGVCSLFIWAMGAGFLFNAMYTSQLSSFLTNNLPGKQIETFQDLWNRGLNFMVIQEEEGFNKWEIGSEYVRLVKKSEPYNVVKLHREKLNSSFAYNLPTDKWEVLYLAQKIKNNVIFKEMSEKRLGLFVPMALPFNRSSILKKAFDKFVVDIYSAGLMIKWRRVAVFEMQQAGLLLELPRVSYSKERPLNLEYYYIIVIGLGLGWMTSIVAFYLEIRRFRFDFIIKN